MDRQRILLTEYETCQSHNNALGNQSWISISILITVNLLVLAEVVTRILLQSVPIKGYANLIVVILLGFVMIIILHIFGRWNKRITFQTWLNNDRMREIETTLEMWKNWRIRGLDLYYGKNQDEQKKKKWYRLPRRLRRVIFRLSQRYPQKDKKAKQDENYETMYILPTTEGSFCKGQFKFKCIFPALMIVWGIVIVLEVLIYCCSFVQDCLF